MKVATAWRYALRQSSQVLGELVTRKSSSRSCSRRCSGVHAYIGSMSSRPGEAARSSGRSEGGASRRRSTRRASARPRAAALGEQPPDRFANDGVDRFGRDGGDRGVPSLGGDGEEGEVAATTHVCFLAPRHWRKCRRSASSTSGGPWTSVTAVRLPKDATNGESSAVPCASHSAWEGDQAVRLATRGATNVHTLRTRTLQFCPAHPALTSSRMSSMTHTNTIGETMHPCFRPWSETRVPCATQRVRRQRSTPNYADVGRYASLVRAAHNGHMVDRVVRPRERTLARSTPSFLDYSS